MARAATRGDIYWILPGRKRPFAYSTKATSDLIVLVSENGCTVSEAIDLIHYDDEAKRILRALTEAGYGNRPLRELVG